jgi:hypothetical protein
MFGLVRGFVRTAGSGNWQDDFVHVAGWLGWKPGLRAARAGRDVPLRRIMAR